MKSQQSSNIVNASPQVRQVKGEIVDDQREATKRQIEMLAWILDESIAIPGLNVRMGVDGLLGLVPVVGDFISAALSMYIVACAHSLGAPKSVLLRMSANSAIDFVVGSVPVVGDVFDIGWKANRRNVKLLQAHLENPQQLQIRSRTMMGVFSVGLIAVVVGVLSLIGWFVSRIWSA